MCLPIRVEGRILGTLHIYRERGYVFNKTAVALASSLADQAGIAIENARLFAELNESYANSSRPRPSSSAPRSSAGSARWRPGSPTI